MTEDCVHGIDVGATVSVVVDANGQILRNELGGHTSASLVSFSGQSRLLGEAAVPAKGQKNTVSHPLLLLGNSLEELKGLAVAKHFPVTLSEQAGQLTVEVDYKSNPNTSFNAVQICGMLLAKLRSLAVTDEQNGVFGLVVPSWMTEEQRSHLVDAAKVARLSQQGASEVHLVRASEALCNTFNRKHGSGEADRTVAFIDHGESQLNALIATFHPDGSYTIKAEQALQSLGVGFLDTLIFDALATKCEALNVPRPVPGTKNGNRLMKGVEKIRKLLSTMLEATVQVENLAEDRDVSLSLTRGELGELLGPSLETLKQTLSTLLEASSVSPEDLESVELMGGGSRMPLVQQAISEVMKTESFGQKLDDASLAFGAALAAQAKLAKQQETTEEDSKQQETTEEDSKEESEKTEDGKEGAVNDSSAPVQPPEPPTAELETVGVLTEEALNELLKAESEMKESDMMADKLAESLNAVESFILEMRNAPSTKHGSLIADRQKLNEYLDGCEDWLWNVPAEMGVSEVQAKLDEVKTEINEMCKDFFAAIEAEQKKMEQELEAEAAKGAIERENDESLADKDSRRLPKAERMRKVMKHKETGTELFKGKNYMHAAKHYKDALTHCSKFFDLSPEDDKEVKAVKLTLHLNLAQCWVKLDNFDQVLKHANEALAIDDSNPKALFRRAMVYEKKKEFELAKQDLQKAQQHPNGEKDANIATLMKRITILMNREKEKEKKMWGKAFG